MPLQLIEEDFRHPERVLAVREARFVRKGVVLQPGQQALGGRADHIRLREVHVQVDEARRHDAAWEVRARHAFETRRSRREVR